MRDSFIFYRSFYEAFKDLPRDVQGEVFTAICEYSLNGITTENLKPIARGMFTLIKPQLDANNQRYKNGAKGGRPKSDKNQTETKTEPNEHKNVNVNLNENIELIYNSYPTRCVVGGRSTGKSAKNKDKLKILLKTITSDKLIDTIKWYVSDCKKTNTYMMNFSTFLNNIPDVPGEYKPIESTTKPKTDELQ